MNNECSKASPVSPINGLFKTIWVKLSPKRLCLLGDLNTEHEGSSPASLRNSLFQDQLLSKTIILTHCNSLPGDLNNEHTVSCTFFYVSNHIYTHIMTQTWLPHHKIWATQPIRLNGDMDPTHLPISAKIQPNATATFHIIVKYVPEEDMLLKYQIHATYANYFIYRYQTAMSLYIPLINSPHQISLQTLVHTFHILGICPWTNMPVISHMYAPLP